jgi:hypothetical protein
MQQKATMVVEDPCRGCEAAIELCFEALIRQIWISPLWLSVTCFSFSEFLHPLQLASVVLSFSMGMAAVI